MACFCFPVQAQESLATIRGQLLSGSEESWQKLQPVVECGEDAMTLTVKRRRPVQLFLDRGEAVPSQFIRTPALLGVGDSFLKLLGLRYAVSFF